MGYRVRSLFNRHPEPKMRVLKEAVEALMNFLILHS